MDVVNLAIAGAAVGFGGTVGIMGAVWVVHGIGSVLGWRTGR